MVSGNVRFTKRPVDDLYVEIEYQPNAFYLSQRWQAYLRSESADYSVGGKVYGMFEWTLRIKARRMLARKRRARKLNARAHQYGKKVIR